MFLDTNNFTFTAQLEANWTIIRSEFERLEPTARIAWPERQIYTFGWEVFGLYAFNKKLAANCELCPETTKLVETVPGLTTAGFSVLQPGAHILPHCGYTNAVLRCHLGLITPSGCKFRVGHETRTWQEGKCLIFDDTLEHEVWHNGDSTRVVLLLDFAKPSAGFATGGSTNVVMPDVVDAIIKSGGIE